MTDDRTRNGPAQPPSLAEAIDRLADERGDIHRHDSGVVVEYVRGATVFATCHGGSFGFRLRPEIAAAALRTPDTTLSARGHDWISLQPHAVDAFALDRALAWFESAWRRAGEPYQPLPLATPARPN